MSIASKYYSLMDIENNPNDEKLFSHFIGEIYVNEMHNDYTHIIRKHNHQIQDMKELLIKNKIFEECNISKCMFTTRHQSHHAYQTTQNTFDPVLNAAKQTFDSLHFYFLHLFECGLRSINTRDEEEEIKDGDEADEHRRYTCFDDRFSRLVSRINETRAKTKGFHRLQNNQKFNLQTNSSNDNDKERTFLDHMMKNVILQAGIHRINHDDKDTLLQVKYLVSDEEYDTDSIQYDVDHDNGNICGRMQNEVCISSIKETVDTAQLHSSLFSIGFRFYYWPFYKSIKQLPLEELQYASAVDDHGGYDISDLFVEQKHSSFKEEIANYAHLSKKQYDTKVVVKASIYKDTDTVKGTKRSDDPYTTLHYDIDKEARLGYDHLVSLILYTDFSNLSADFSNSFRKKSAFEPLSLVKRRNRKYWWLSKLLREAVECFGLCRMADEDTINSGLSGPFYCGMSCVMIIPAFNLRLYSPVSTSKQIEIAMKFSGPNGIILQLNNMSEGKSDDVLRAFDCSWLSRYPEEDERLFFGGFWQIKLESVRIIETQQNFHEFVAAAYYLDAILTGALSILSLPQSETNKLYISLLLNRSSKDKRIDDYIYDTFDGYLKQKKQISLNLYYLSRCKDKDILDLVMNPLEIRVEARGADDKTNLLREEAVAIFKYTENVFIMSGYSDGNQYPLSMPSLLCLVAQAAWKQVIVKAVKKKGNKDSWISSLWRNKEKELKKQWKQQNYNIKYKQNECKKGQEHWLMIDKI